MRKSLTDTRWQITQSLMYSPSAAPGSAIPARNIVALFYRDIFIGQKLKRIPPIVQLTLVNIILGEPKLNCLSPAKSIARTVASASKNFYNFETKEM